MRERERERERVMAGTFVIIYSSYVQAFLQLFTLSPLDPIMLFWWFGEKNCVSVCVCVCVCVRVCVPVLCMMSPEHVQCEGLPQTKELISPTVFI